MPKYNKAFKSSVLEQLLPPQNKSISEVSRLTGVTKQTLRAWKKSVKERGAASTEKNGNATKWSSEDKFMIVLNKIIPDTIVFNIL